MRSKPAPSPVLIVSPTTYSEYGLNESLQVGKKRKSNSLDEVRNAQKLDTVVDGKFPNDRDSEFIFSKVIGSELSHGSRDDLYSRCRMNFLDDILQTEAPQFVDLGLLAINKLNESGVLGTTVTRIQKSMYGFHWTDPDHVFGKAKAVGMSVARSD